jgi:hypothetical protein
MAIGPGGKQIVFDFRCEKCGAVTAYAEYTLAPSKCGNQIRAGNGQETCNGLMRKLGEREINHINNWR